VGTAIVSAFVKYTGADPGVVGPEAYTIFGALFKKKEYKITCVSEHPYRVREEISKNYKFKKVPNTTNIQKNAIFY